MMEELSESAKELRKVKTQLRNSFVAQVQGQLATDQLDHWPSLERALLRKKTLPLGRLDGERVDLVRLVEKLDLDDEGHAAVAEPLEDLDPQAPRGANHYAHCRNWLECIKDRRTPHADVEIGHRSATVCHLMNIARLVSERMDQTGQRMQWDPQGERFTNCEWGNHYLDRPRRNAYHLPDQI